MQKKISILFFLFMAASVSWSIYRDIQIEKEYTGDLRNRIVGARLQKDGHAPYFYKWKTGDNLRYYDPQNFDTLKVSNITATPFFHQLLYPVADMEQRKISRVWLAVEYLLLFIMTGIALSFTKNSTQQTAVFITPTIFLYTNAWTGHVAAGQLYLLIPCLALLFYCFINKEQKLFYAVLAGVCAAILLLVRPNTIIFFLPFLFFIPRYTLKYTITLFFSMALIFFFAFNSSRKISYWKDYSHALSAQLKSHLDLSPAIMHTDADPGYTNWEGWYKKEIAKDAAAFPYTYNMEHGNVFVLLNHSLNVKMPVWLLATASFLFILLLSYLFYKKNNYTHSFDLYHAAILAFCLYMVTDIFSPIHRFQYNATQWLFPLLLAAAGYNAKYKWIYAGIISGLVLNSINLSFMVMEQTLGEYIVFGFLLILLFRYKPRAAA